MKRAGNKKEVRLTYPSMALIPVIAVVCAIIKACGGTDLGWITALLVAPVAIYVSWSIGYCLMLMVGMLTVEAFRKDKDNEQDGE